MKDREILSIKTDDTKVCIVEDILFVGSPDDDSERPDIAFELGNDVLYIDGWKLSPAQLLTLKLYLNKEF